NKKITELIESILQDTDCFLIEVEVKGSRTPKISVFVDRHERNVNLDECAEISNELGFLIDAHEIFDDSYRLNVSSPGLSRPLVDRRQYPKNRGRKVSVTYQEDDEQTALKGTLTEVFDDKIIVKKNNENVALPFDEIIETKVIPSLK